MIRSDTIAAIATALSDSGIGIVRMSGERAVDIGNQIYVSKNGCQSLRDFGSHTLHYGYITDGARVLDEVMVSVMKAPNSYTREDVVEINCHGGVLVLQRVLELVLSKGARLADPGEFTKRAYLNGRIDLAEAEAVMDLIRAKNDYALQSSVRQLSGSLSKKIESLRQDILNELAYIEAALDDPEHISMEGYGEELAGKLEPLIDSCERLIRSAENGSLLKEGISTVILGKPNAGKSSLLNRLLNRQKAIVTEIPGTTRDILEDSIMLDSIPLRLYDTAGIRQTTDQVERIGVQLAIEAAEDADLILYVVDASVPLDDNDLEILKLIRDKKRILLLNKSDLPARVTMEQLREKTGANVPVIKTCLRTAYSSEPFPDGIQELSDTIRNLFFAGQITYNDEVFITSLRHKEALQAARDSLKLVMSSIQNHLPEDFYSIDLMDAYADLGSILGVEVEDDLVDEIFSKFCMGK